MGLVTVHVLPRSRRVGVRVEARGIVVRVRSAPEAGKATQEARRALAAALRVPGSAIRLRTGASSRNKTFEIPGLGQHRAEMRINATLGT
jgi:uncharacterized protein